MITTVDLVDLHLMSAQGRSCQPNLPKQSLELQETYRRPGRRWPPGTCPCCSMETRLPSRKALQLPAGWGSSSLPAASSPEGSWSCPGPLARKTGLPTCSDGTCPEPWARQPHTSLAQRLILVFIISLINGKPSRNNFCYVRASVLEEECRSFPLLRWLCCSQSSGQASLHGQYSARKANLD